MRDLRSRGKRVAYADPGSDLYSQSDSDNTAGVRGGSGSRGKKRKNAGGSRDASSIMKYISKGCNNTQDDGGNVRKRSLCRPFPARECNQDGGSVSSDSEDFQRTACKNPRTAPVVIPQRQGRPIRMAAAKPAVRDVKGSYGLEELSDGKKGGEQVGNSKKLEQESSDEEGESSDEEEESSEQEEEARAPPSRRSTRTTRALVMAEEDSSDGDEEGQSGEEEEARPPLRRSTRNTRMQARAGKNSDIDDVDHSGSSVPRANPVGSGSGSPSRSSGSEIRRSRPGCDPSGDEVEHSEDEDGSSDEEGSGDDSEEDEDGLKGEIQQIFAVKGDGEEQRVLVKYKGLSHHHNNWVPGEEIWNTRKQLINNFIVKNGITGEYKDENGHPNGVNPDWLRVERVIGARQHRGDEELLVKWCSLPYSESTWEPAEEVEDTAKEALELYLKYNTRARAVASIRRKKRVKCAVPSFLNGRKLRDYQEESLRWNISNWVGRRNCILGDEMGLGKTAQSIAVMEAQRQSGHPGPFLVVAPLTTLGHWKREVETWTSMSCVMYIGSQSDRKIIQDYEMSVPASDKGNRKTLGTRFDVLLTSYESLRMDQKFLQRFHWQSAIVDEAHRLKSTTALARQAIESMDIGWLLLLTGTPIQNNLQELFGLMNLLDPEKFPDLDDFCDRFGAGGTPTPEQVADLQEALKPILLRRMKEDVETLPEKEEVIIWVELTREQRAYYKAIYSREIGTLLAGASSKNMPNLRNLCMELRKVCCHPYLCNGLEEDMAMREAANKRSEVERLVAASGKMLLLNKLLPKLKAEGHKVLIFSQFCIMLDVLEDYLRLSGYATERIDGSTGGGDRQAAIDRYCKDDSNGFVFLLSTKAGGQGITLTAADTVIIYDSDWNPQNDLQAMARCHRIGQQKEVTIYRLLSRDTYEQAVFHSSSRKYGLDEAVLGGMGAQGTSDPEADRERIIDLLKNGAHSLAGPDDKKVVATALACPPVHPHYSRAIPKAADETAFASEDIEKILKGRTEKRQIGSRAGNTFSVATFAVDDAGDKSDEMEDVPAGGWDALMPEAVEAHWARVKAAKAAHLEGPSGPRNRKRVNYNEVAAAKSSSPDENSPEREQRTSSGNNAWSPSDSDVDDLEDGAEGLGQKRRPRQIVGKSWTKAEVKCLVDTLAGLGEGRTKQVRHLAGLTKKPFQEVVAVEAAVLSMIHFYASAQPQGRSATQPPPSQTSQIPAAPLSQVPQPPVAAEHNDSTGFDSGSRKEMIAGKSDPACGSSFEQKPMQQQSATVSPLAEGIDVQKIPREARMALTNNTTIRMFEKDASFLAQSLAQRNALARLIHRQAETVASAAGGGHASKADGCPAPEERESLTTQPNMRIKFAPCLPRKGSLPYWWGRLHDSALLAGSHKFGISRRGIRQVELVLEDPTLGFPGVIFRKAEPPSNDSSLADTVESRGSLKADNTCDCLSEGNGVGNAMGVQGASAAEELAGGGSKPFAKDTGVKQTEGNMVKVCLNVEDDKVTMKAEVKEAEMMNSEVKAMGKGIAEEKKKQAEVRKDDTAWLPDAEEEVLSALGRAVRDFNTRIPPEPLDSEAWKKFATTVSQRLRQLLQKLVSGPLDDPSPIRRQPPVPQVPSYISAITSDVRAQILGRMCAEMAQSASGKTQTPAPCPRPSSGHSPVQVIDLAAQPFTASANNPLQAGGFESLGNKKQKLDDRPAGKDVVRPAGGCSDVKEEPIDLVDSDSDEEGGQNRGAGYPHFTPLGADTRKSSKGDSAPLPVPGGPKGREGDAPRAPLLTVNPNVSWPEQRLHKAPAPSGPAKPLASMAWNSPVGSGSAPTELKKGSIAALFAKCHVKKAQAQT